jgi:NAD(P)-dependent dehydrogenase (short-subunit alcohol dehydrogenase family)
MTEFAGRTAVVTGGGSGMGRELIRQLVEEACNIAMCDVSPTGLAETQRLCEAVGLPQGLRVTTHIVDVADRTQVERFRDEVADVTRPTRSTCCSTTPVSVVAAA